MCLIIIKRKGIKINNNIYEIVEKAAENNRDGIGISYRPPIKGNAKSTEIETYKYLNDTKGALKKIAELNVERDGILMIHLRMATNGPVELVNVQPISLHYSAPTMEHYNNSKSNTSRNPVMAHNGIMSDFTYDNVKFSDSYLFAKDFLNKYSGEITTKKMVEILFDAREQAKTYANYKLEMSKYPLFANNRISIIHPEKGLLLAGGTWWVDNHGIMYSSNTSYVKKMSEVKN